MEDVKKKVKKEVKVAKAPRVPAHVKEAKTTLAEYLDQEVTAKKLDNGGWVLNTPAHKRKPEMWKSLPVEK